jgi:acyl-CoA reductase-like NAD-dependent aldehyde dehydrogenase
MTSGAKTPRLLIGSEWRETGRTKPVINPYSGEEVAQVPLGDAKTVDKAIKVAHEAFEVTRAQSPHARGDLLSRVAQRIEKRRAEFVETMISEAGKPYTFADGEVTRAIITFAVASEEARRQQGELLDIDAYAPGSGHFGLVRRFPLGVISAITPFNFPLNLVAHKVAPGMASGNTLVVKPALKTPLTALLLAEVLVESDMPAGQVNFVTCNHEEAGALITDSRVKMVSFTGSPDVGWRLKEQCGKKKITLELGGNAGVIVHEDADVKSAVPKIAVGAFSYAGQSCISVQRIVVQEPIYEDFKKQFVDYVREHIQTGDPRDKKTVVGPMIDAGALDRIAGWVESARRSGAKILCGGNVKERCLEATVIEKPSRDLDVCAKEAFAPIVTLHSYKTFDDALKFVNDSDFGLQAGVFTQGIGRAMQAFEQLDVGGVLINNVPTFRADNMPYGGLKDSGFGREGVRFAMEEMTELKSLILNNS